MNTNKSKSPGKGKQDPKREETGAVSKPGRDASIKDIQAFLETRIDIPFAYVFGSFLDEEHFRDIDLGIYIDETAAIIKGVRYFVRHS